MGFSVSTTANPSYMYQSPSGYIFRLRIPNDLKSVVGKCEFRYSLRTGALRVAKHRARCIASYIQQLFIKVRSSMAEFTQEQITNLVQGYIRETLANDEKCRAISGPTADGTTTLEGMTLLESSDMNADEAESILKSVNRWLKQQDHSLMKPVTEKLINTQDAEIATESDSHQTLSRELLKAFQSVLKVRIMRSEGDYSLPDDELIPILKQQPGAISEVSVAQTEEPLSLTFSEVQEHYLAEIEKANSWTEKTKAKNLSIFALFVRVMGDLAVDEIDRKLMSEYKATLMKLPPNLNKGKEYKSKSIEDICNSTAYSD